MPSIDVFDKENKKVSSLEIKSEIFESPVREDILHTVVNWQLTKRRSGTASTKTRGEVRGGGSKPWRQKGTGRARQGSNRSPLWRKGAIIFGPKPKEWAYKVPKKVRKNALRSVLALKFSENKIFVVDSLELNEIKTRNVQNLLKKFDLKSALIVDKDNENLYKSSRNIIKVKYINEQGINVYDILKYDNLIISSDSLNKVQEAFEN